MSKLLNLPWVFIGLIASIISLPKLLSFKGGAICINVFSFWWYKWIPSKRRVRAMTIGNIVLLGPDADRRDLAHELIHVRQYEEFPFIFPFLYIIETLRHGYRNNKFEIEAYEKSGNRFESD